MVLLALAAVIFDASSLTWEERCTVETLQGLVNREGPLLYLDYGSSWDQKWLDIYAERNGMRYQRIASMGELLERFGGAAKGLVIYDPQVDGCRYAAMTLAGVEDLLPVSPDVLSGRSPGMTAAHDWPGVDFTSVDDEPLRAWRRAADPHLTLTPGRGLTIQEGNPNPDHPWSFISRGPITVDLARYPLLEVDVADVEGEAAKWGIKLTWDRDGNHRIGGGQDDLSLPGRAEAGVHRWDIAKLAGIDARHTFALIQLHVLGPDAEVTWRRVRFVSRDGQAPPDIPPTPLTEMGLPIRHDLRGRFADSVAAYQWMLQDVMPRCNRGLAHAVDGTVEGVKAGCGPFPGFDWPVMHRSPIFNLACPPEQRRSYGTSKVGGSAEQAAMYERIVAALEPPAQITGYGEPEDYWCNLLSESGHYSFHFGTNWSFHNKVPDDARPLRQKRRFTPETATPESDKHYVCFMTSEGDTMKGPIPFFYGSWFDERRGSVPMNWGINPLMASHFPAMLRYFYETATDSDYFFVGCSGAGYCYPDNMPNLEEFARHTAEACALADTPCVDLWGAKKSETLATYARVINPLGLTVNASPAKMDWLVGGVPAAFHELAYWQHAAVGDTGYARAFADDARRADAVAWLVARIEQIARRFYAPSIILVYADLHSYAHHAKVHREVADALDPTRFKPARLDEAFADWRAWAGRRAVIGADGLNERLVWATLAGIPTSVPLTLTNGGAQPLQAEVDVQCAGRPIRAEVALAPRESSRVRDLVLTLEPSAGDAAAVIVTTGDEQQRRDVDLSIVPAPREIPSASLAAVWGAASLRHSGGAPVADERALFGEAWASPDTDEPGHIVFGPYADLPAGRYIAAFRMKLAPDGDEQAQDVAVTIDMHAGGYDGLGEASASRDVRIAEFTAPDQWQWFTTEGDWPGPPSLLETRVQWPGGPRVMVDRIAVFRMTG